MRNPTRQREHPHGSTPLGLVLSLTLTLILTLGLAISPAARASNGVVEINHTCAVQTGCFPGDSPGYPVFIDGQAGSSYRLTSDLIVPNVNTDGILFNASDIGIDLNNFAIIGVGCVGSTTNCTPSSGTGSGIERTSGLNRGVSVKNGNIIGMGRFGVFIGDHAQITNLSVRWNGVDGINTSSGSTVSGNTVYQNGRYGINVFTASIVSGNTASENVSHGIFTGDDSTVSGNTARQNGSAGFAIGFGSTVSGNTANQNGTVGILAGSGSTVSGNTAYQNTGSGIVCSGGCAVQGNTSRLNGGFGLSLGVSFGPSAYRENVISSNTLGPVFGGVNMLGNSCDGATTCP